MPTGYTAPVADGKATTLEEYILDVSRGMGFAYHLRDSSFTGDIPLQTVEPYYSESYIEAVEKLDRWNSMDTEQRRQAWEEYVQDVVDSNKRAIERYEETKQRYESMLEKVKAWDPPEILASTKAYAIEQLEGSIDFDCGRGPYTSASLSFDRWAEWNEDRLFNDVEYYLGQWNKARKRVAESNAYITALYESLGLETP